MTDAPRPIALIGLMGAGKSAVARAIGEQLGVAVADLDEILEAEEGRSIADLFRDPGEAAFRRMEGRVLRRVLSAAPRVIACGGGVVLDPALRELLKSSCRVVWLQVAPELAARRLAHDARQRPLLSGEDVTRRLERMEEERGARYAETAQVRVPTDGRTPEQVAEAVLDALGAVSS